jgi:hypothetical protein
LKSPYLSPLTQNPASVTRARANRRAVALLLVTTAGLAAPALADDSGVSLDESEFGEPLYPSLRDIGLELSNPVTGLRQLTLDIEYETYQGTLPGSSDQNGRRVVFKPTWPIKLGNGKNLLLSMRIPVNGDLPNWKPETFIDYRDFTIRKVPVDEPRIEPTAGEFGYVHDHLEDISIDVGYGGVSDNGLISMISLVNVFPTSEDQSGARNQWLIGPEFALGKVTKWGLFGARLKHLVDTGDREGAQELGYLPTTETTLRPFFAYALKNGWQIESNPVILYDWEAVDDNELLLPIAAGFSKTFRVGRRPMKLGVELNYYVVSPDRFGPEWMIQLRYTPVVGTSQLQ